MTDVTTAAPAVPDSPVRKPHRWVKGQSGNPAGGGRPPGLEFRALVEKHLGRGPLSLALLAVFRNLLAMAKDADHPLTVQAGKLLLDRLCAPVDADKAGAAGATVIILDTGGIRPPTVPTTRLAITASDVTTVGPDPVGPD